jgi:ribosomal protein S18 acetylase RimI-like enzyme
MALRGDEIVGRIAGIMSPAANEKDGVRDVRFGWFDCMNDPEAARALFDAISEWGRTFGMETMSGPHGFSLFDREGLLVEGFDRMPTFATYYNHAYYQDLVEGCGFGKRYDFIEYRTENFDQKEFPSRVSDLADKVLARGKFRVLKFRNRRQIKAMGPQIFDLLEETYMELADMLTFTKKQIQYYIPKFMPFVHRELLKVVVADNGEVAGFMLAMPSISEALRRANGRLLPFGFLHLLRALRKFDTLDFCLAGVRKKYRGKGIDLIMAREMFRSAKKPGVKYTESNPELETNLRIQSEWKHFDPIQHKRRRIYEMRIAEAHIVPFRDRRPAPRAAPARKSLAAQ